MAAGKWAVFPVISILSVVARAVARNTSSSGSGNEREAAGVTWLRGPNAARREATTLGENLNLGRKRTARYSAMMGADQASCTLLSMAARST